MQLSIFGMIRGIFPSHSKDREKELAKLQAQENAYIRGSIANRGPCPGLNALANHGYLPRDGKSITIPMVEAALIGAFHHDELLAHTLANALKPLLDPKSQTFDLTTMRRHNVVERDVSFTRLDFRHGDNYSFQPHLFEAMIRDTEPTAGVTTVDSLARTYKRRTREEKKDGADSLPVDLYFVSLVQTVSFLHSAGVGGKMEEGVLREFFEEERLSEVITGNKETRRLWGLVGMALGLAGRLWFGKI